MGQVRSGITSAVVESLMKMGTNISWHGERGIDSNITPPGLVFCTANWARESSHNWSPG